VGRLERSSATARCGCLERLSGKIIERELPRRLLFGPPRLLAGQSRCFGVSHRLEQAMLELLRRNASRRAERSDRKSVLPGYPHGNGEGSPLHSRSVRNPRDVVVDYQIGVIIPIGRLNCSFRSCRSYKAFKSLASTCFRDRSQVRNQSVRICTSDPATNFFLPLGPRSTR
jgi:hypothetical protein